MLLAFSILLLLIGALCGILYLREPEPLPALWEIDVNIDESFTCQERILILNGLSAWQKATHNLVVYNIYDMHAAHMLLHNNGHNALNFVRVHSEHPKIAKYEKKYGGICMGLTYNRVDSRIIYLIHNRLDNKKQWNRIILHEIGHTLGLNHTKQRGTIMYPFVCGMSDKITKSDVCQLISNVRNYLAYCHSKYSKTN